MIRYRCEFSRLYNVTSRSLAYCKYQSELPCQLKCFPFFLVPMARFCIHCRDRQLPDKAAQLKAHLLRTVPNRVMLLGKLSVPVLQLKVLINNRLELSDNSRNVSLAESTSSELNKNNFNITCFSV